MDVAGHVSRQMLARYSHIRMEAKRKALEGIVPIHHLLETGRVSTESYRCAQHRSVGLDDRFDNLPAGVVFNAHARRFYQATKATQTMGQLHFAQAEDPDFRAVPPEHVQQPLKNRGRDPGPAVHSNRELRPFCRPLRYLLAPMLPPSILAAGPRYPWRSP